VTATRNSTWWIVVAGALGTAVGAGIFMVYAFGILGKALTAEYQWDRSVVQYCLTSFLVATGFGAVLLGNVMNRWGVRKPAMASIALFATAIAGLAVLPASTFLFYGVFAVIGVASVAATAMPYAVSVAGWFDRNRGLALGLVNTGAGIGAALAPQYANYLVTHYGWRGGFLGVALVAGLIPLFGLAFLVREPPIARSPTPAATAASARFAYLRNRNFWLIAVAILGVSIAMFGVMGSMVSLLTDRGVSGATVAGVLSAAGVSSWLGRIAVGFAMDKVFAPYVAAFSFALALAGVGLIAFTEAPAPLMLGAALIGFTFGAEGDLVTFLASRYFGMDIYSKVLGALWVTWAWGGGIGTYLVGVSFSATQSYEVALTIFGLVLIASSVAVLMLGPYVVPPERLRAEPDAISVA
jgi:MFS family permease